MSKQERQFRYRAIGGGANFVAVEILVPREDREIVLRFAEKLRAKYRAKVRRTTQSDRRALRIDDYPQLKLIAWSRTGTRYIDEQDALALYERNWRFIEHDKLTANERALIAHLAQKFGQGLLHV